MWLNNVLINIVHRTWLYNCIYRVSQEERSIFWEVIVSVILNKKLYTNMCPIPNSFQDRAIWLYSGLAWTPSIVLPSRPAAPLSEACESVAFSNIYYKLYQLCHLNNKYRYYVGDPKSKVSIMLGLQGNCSRDCWPHCCVHWFPHSQTSHRSAR